VGDSKFLIGWRQVASSFVMLAAIAMITSSYGVIAVPLAAEFNPTRMVLMLAITVVSAVSGVLAPVLGSVMDRFSLRLLMLAGSLLLCTGYAALSFAHTFVQVLVIFGVLIAPANVLLGPVAVTVLLSRWFVRRRGMAIGIAIAGVSMGGVLFPPLIQFLLETYEWRMAMRVFALLLLLIVVPAAALVVNEPGDKGLHPDGAGSESEEARSEQTQAKASVMTILSDPAFWMIGLLFAIVLSGMKAVVTNLTPLAIDEGVDATAAALLVSIYSACGFVSKLSFAAIADRLKPRILALISFAGFAAGMVCLSEASAGFWIIVAGASLMGLFGGFMVPLKSLLAPRIFGRGVVGRAMGLLSTLSLCVSLTTPPLFGYMFDVTGSYSLICLVFAGLAAGAMLLVPYIRMQPRQVVAV
jgi:predicted MFS family arabinose efflux permease